MTRWLILSVLLLTVIGLAVYGYLGGFRPADIAITTTAKPIFLAGRQFRGSVRDDAFGSFFRQAEQVRASGAVRGELANIYYNNPATARDTVHAFVGLVVADTTSQRLPVGYRYRTFGAGQRVIRARTTASYLLAPNKLYPAVEETAQQRKLTLRQVYLEQFSESGTSEVLAVVK